MFSGAVKKVEPARVAPSFAAIAAAQRTIATQLSKRAPIGLRIDFSKKPNWSKMVTQLHRIAPSLPNQHVFVSFGAPKAKKTARVAAPPAPRRPAARQSRAVRGTRRAARRAQSRSSSTSDGPGSSDPDPDPDVEPRARRAIGEACS